MITFSMIFGIYILITLLWLIIFIMEIFSTDIIVLYTLIAIFVVSVLFFLFIYSISNMHSFPNYYQAVFSPAILLQVFGAILFLFMLIIFLFSFTKVVFLINI